MITKQNPDTVLLQLKKEVFDYFQKLRGRRVASGSRHKEKLVLGAFKRYTSVTIRARLVQLIRPVDSHQQRMAAFRTTADDVLKHLERKLWRSTVARAWDGTHVIAYLVEEGNDHPDSDGCAWDSTYFQRPPKQALRVMIQGLVNAYEIESLKATSDRGPAVGPFDERKAKAFCDRLKSFLKKMRGGRPVEEFTEFLGISTHVYYKLMQGQCRCDQITLDEVAKKLGCQSSDLYNPAYDKTRLRKRVKSPRPTSQLR